VTESAIRLRGVVKRFGPITAVEIPATKTAVIRFQRAAHLKPDGLWGAKSQAALDKMLHRH